MPYDFEVIHRKGSEHTVPDFLSRSLPTSADVVEAVSTPDIADRWYRSMISKILTQADKYPLWRVQDDKLYKHVSSRYSDLGEPSDEWKLVVPKDQRHKLIESFHDVPTSGHCGVAKTVARISRIRDINSLNLFMTYLLVVIAVWRKRSLVFLKNIIGQSYEPMLLIMFV
ncbi:Integrase zinc binding domain [Popillia japonica]|uniref:Integrase zinc binding domain n=1 Tax=Popillia japonica TaxID=7064 RepID=A0AAW1HFD2_POPJA